MCRALSDLGHEQLIVHPEQFANYAYDEGDTRLDYAEAIPWPTPEAPPETAELQRIVREFEPDAMVGTWARTKSYRTVLKAQPNHVVRVAFMDNTWHATPRQWLGRATHRLFIDPAFDLAMVCSDRSEWFARRLGFSADDIIRGAATADTAVFNAPPRSGAELAGRRQFVFGGRLVEEKGVDMLIDAYRTYREASDDPWGLAIAGTGPLASVLEGITGVTMHGFVQPPQLAELMRASSCFVLPSRFEPFGVVTHEAAACGLPILISEIAGSAPGMVQDGTNGWMLPVGDAAIWADAFARVSSAGTERLGHMSDVSRGLALRYSPADWALNFHEQVTRRLA